MESRNTGKPVAMTRSDQQFSAEDFVSEMPHGGFRNFGYGKDLSMYGFEDYTRVKHVMSNIES